MNTREPVGFEDVTESMDRLLLRAPKVAKVLDVSVSMAYRMMQNGELPTIRIGRSLRVPRKALLKWVEEHTRPGLVAA